MVVGAKPLLSLAALLVLSLSGCTSGGGAEADSDQLSIPGTTSGALNRAPTGSLNVSAVNGSVPLTVNFTLNGTDLDGDALNWTLSFGDGNETNGTALPAQVAHNYTAPGSFNVTLNLTDGLNSTLYTTVVVASNGTGNASAAAEVQAPEQLTGSVVCAPTFVVKGEVAGSSNELVVLEGQKLLTLTLSYDDPGGAGLTDLDITVTDPNGDSETSEEVGPEPPLVFESPAAGTWTLALIGYSCMGEASYTVDATFA
jgi:PKD repeat protein